MDERAWLSYDSPIHNSSFVGMTHRPHFHHYRDNWRNSDLPLARKVALFVRNNARKVARLSDCCGNYGEPGC